MIAADLVDRLQRSLRRSSELMRRLLDGMQARRAHWASAVPGTLAPSTELETLAAELADEDRNRRSLIADAASQLPAAPGVAAEDLHVNVSRICASLPKDPATALRRAADDAVRFARLVRVETSLGERLLRFTQRAQEQTLAAVAGAPVTPTNGYDRNARTRNGYGLGVTRAGNLLDGKI